MPLTDLGVELTEVELNELSLSEALEELQKGSVLLISNYEETRGKDVLVRLDNRKYAVTQISFGVEPIEYGERFWVIHNVSINALSLNKVYKYNESLYSIKHKYSPQSIVYYNDGEAPRQIAVVDKVFIGTDNKVYYTLDNENIFFSEEDLFTEADPSPF